MKAEGIHSGFYVWLRGLVRSRINAHSEPKTRLSEIFAHLLATSFQDLHVLDAVQSRLHLLARHGIQLALHALEDSSEFGLQGLSLALLLAAAVAAAGALAAGAAAALLGAAPGGALLGPAARLGRRLGGSSISETRHLRNQSSLGHRTLERLERLRQFGLGLGFRVSGFGLRASGFGFRV